MKFIFKYNNHTYVKTLQFVHIECVIHKFSDIKKTFATKPKIDFIICKFLSKC